MKRTIQERVAGLLESIKAALNALGERLQPRVLVLQPIPISKR